MRRASRPAGLLVREERERLRFELRDLRGLLSRTTDPARCEELERLIENVRRQQQEDKASRPGRRRNGG